MPRTFTQFLRGWFPSASLYVEGKCEGRSPSSLPGPRGNSEDDATRQGSGAVSPTSSGLLTSVPLIHRGTQLSGKPLTGLG